MPIKCASCNQDNPENNHFCGQCGAQLDPQGERLRAQIAALLESKYKDQNLVGIAVADKIEERLWARGKVVGLAVTIFIAALALFGYQSVESAKKQISQSVENAKDSLDGAVSSAKTSVIEEASKSKTEIQVQSDSIVHELQGEVRPTDRAVQNINTRAKEANVGLVQVEQVIKDYNQRISEVNVIRDTAPTTPIGNIPSGLLQPIKTLPSQIITTVDIPGLLTGSSLRATVLPYTKGDSRPAVSLIQTRLAQLKCYDGQISGSFDEATADAVTRFLQLNKEGVLTTQELLHKKIVPVPDPLLFNSLSPYAPTLESYTPGTVGMSAWEKLADSLVQPCEQ